MLSLLIFILILSILVLIHEFGHFITAKKLGVKVEEFGMGIPPRLYGKKIGETIYSINLFPFGGFVRLKGEDTFDYSKKDLQDPRNFISKTPLQRIAILMAGVFMNIVFGVFLFYVFMFMNGFKTSSIPLIFDHEFDFGNVRKINTVIFEFSEESPLSEEVSLGDAIVSVGGREVNSVEDIREAVASSYAESSTGMITVQIQDARNKNGMNEFEITPYLNEEAEPRLGVYLGSSAQIFYQEPLQRIFAGFLHTYNVLDYSINGLGQLISISFSEGTAEPISEGVSGPIGIYSLVDNIVSYSQAEVLLDLIDLMALISVSLAFLNVLPLPALDGGRVLFVIIELIRGKRVSPKLEAGVHKFGILVLLSLLVLVSIRDVIRIF